jgi:hypothetical protein
LAVETVKLTMMRKLACTRARHWGRSAWRRMASRLRRRSRAWRWRAEAKRCKAAWTTAQRAASGVGDALLDATRRPGLGRLAEQLRWLLNQGITDRGVGWRSKA